MIHYTMLETSDREFLVFKVIGAQSQADAVEIVKQQAGESLLGGESWENGTIKICPLFSNDTSVKLY